MNKFKISNRSRLLKFSNKGIESTILINRE